MDKLLRNKASSEGLPLMDYILQRLKILEEETGTKRTIFAACPNSLSVIKASLRAAKRCNAPIKFAATLNQVDMDGGYTHLTQHEFVKTIREEARIIHFTGPVIIAVDHGGPWLKDTHKTENWSLQQSMDWVKKSFEAAVDAGYDLIHVDPTIDNTLRNGEIINIEVVAERTLELIEHTENYRRSKGFGRISYEVGTEEVHGGLADMKTFNRFLLLLKNGLERLGLSDVWPCFVVGKVGTDLHTTTFDPQVAQKLVKEARKYGSYIKGHYSDSVENPEAYPASGMGAANIGPEFTEREYDGLIELAEIEKSLFDEQRIPKISNIQQVIRDAVINSGRWKKWLNSDENGNNFSAINPARQEWLIKTCSRYIWENPEVLVARGKMYRNVENYGIDAEEVLVSHIEKAMDRYLYHFNLVDLNNLL
ncbi:MAG TPA: class II D-tagatose-bisphosphate aldolase, non-catalytic subunit [Bacteroidales bacterium]|nr:class II D-tagatose-bisphosphate aldolase, non-catalytic subunit [Bacteroidales bacterium]